MIQLPHVAILLLMITFLAITGCLTLTLGNHLYSDNEDKSFGSVVKFICEAGYELQGQMQITCQDDGDWSASVPVCILDKG